MNCTLCHALPGYLAGPWPSAGPPGGVFLLAQNPPQRVHLARPGAFRLHGPRATPPGRLEKAVDPLVAALGGPARVYAAQAVKCAFKDNVVPRAAAETCYQAPLRGEVSSFPAPLFVLLGALAAAQVRRTTHRSRELARVGLPTRGGVAQVYTAVLRAAVLRPYGHRSLLLELPHPATAVRFILPGAWEAGALELLRRHAPHLLPG